MASQIRRRKVGNATITQNLTTGEVTHSVQFGDKLVKNTISKKVSPGGKTRHRTTETRNHGPGIWSRTTKTRTQGGKKDGALGRAIWSGLFGGSSKPKKKKQSVSKPAPPKPIVKVETPSPKAEVKDTVEEPSTGADAFGGIFALGLIIWFGYWVISIFKG